MAFLNDLAFVKKSSASTISTLVGDYRLFNLIFLNILNMSLKCKEKNAWANLDARSILIGASQLSNDSANSLIACLILVHTTEKIEKLNEKDMIESVLLNMLEQCRQDFKVNSFNRLRFQLGCHGDLLACEAHCVKCTPDLFLSVNLILECLSKLCVNHETRRSVYFKVKDILKEFFLKGNYKAVY